MSVSKAESARDKLETLDGLRGYYKAVMTSDQAILEFFGAARLEKDGPHCPKCHQDWPRGVTVVRVFFDDNSSLGELKIEFPG